MVGQLPEFTRRAGFGPWTQLADQARRLQVLGLMGEHARVLAEDRLRAAMAACPPAAAADEGITPWNVREVILNTGNTSALAPGRVAAVPGAERGDHRQHAERGAGPHQVTGSGSMTRGR